MNIRNLFLAFILLTHVGKLWGQSKVNGIRTFASAAAFIGSSYLQAEKELIAANFTPNVAPESTGGYMSYSFFEGSLRAEESEIKIICKDGRVVICGVIYSYASGSSSQATETESTGMEVDLEKLKKSIVAYNYKTRSPESFESADKLYAASLDVEYEQEYFCLYVGLNTVMKELELIQSSVNNELNEEFSHNANKWLLFDNADCSFTLENGKYIVNSKKGGEWYSSIPVSFDGNKDFDISVSVRKLEGPDNYFFGLMLGLGVNTGHYHLAAITGNGYGVYANKGPNPRDLVYAYQQAINAGNSTNRLLIKKRGAKIAFFVNEVQVGETTYELFFGNYFGFRLWSGSEPMTLEFDHFLIQTFD